MVAAYTNRNLVFEQRTSTNQLRSTQAFEAAEAGVEWALAMLNTGRITTSSCDPSADTSLSTFRDRYLNIASDTGQITVNANMANSSGARAWPTCVLDGGDWSCTCPTAAAATPADAAGTQVAPAFRLRFVRPTGTTARPGTVWVQVNGCTRLEASCLDFPTATGAATVTGGDARVRIEALIALKPALPNPPMAAVTARGNLLANGTLQALNLEAGSSGLALMSGGSSGPDSNLVLSGPAGMPTDVESLRSANDPSLAAAIVPASNDRFFKGLYGASPQDYGDQPAAIRIDDCADPLTPCDANRIRAVASRNPGRVLWLEGNVDLSGGASLGSATEPVMLVVEGGDLTISDITVNGVIHGRGTPTGAWSVNGTGGTLRGALVIENNMTVAAGSNLTVVRDASVISTLRTRHGSFVRVPGGWKDF